MTISEELINLYKIYNIEVKKYIKIIESHYDCEILDGAKQGIIPRIGQIGSMTFNFHGAGCKVIDNKICVNWDFPLYDGQVGLDPWKLWQFSKAYPYDHKYDMNLESIKEALMILESTGHVRKSHMRCSNQYIILI